GQGHVEVPRRGRCAEQGPHDRGRIRRSVVRTHSHRVSELSSPRQGEERPMLRALPSRIMTPESDSEIVVDDPTAPARDSPAVTTTRTAEVVVYVLLLALALLLAFDNWRSGMGWAKDGPQTGYLPFYLCVILASASLFGLGVAFRRRAEA